jgi:hypothetical protein
MLYHLYFLVDYIKEMQFVVLLYCMQYFFSFLPCCPTTCDVSQSSLILYDNTFIINTEFFLLSPTIVFIHVLDSSRSSKKQLLLLAAAAASNNYLHTYELVRRRKLCMMVHTVRYWYQQPVCAGTYYPMMVPVLTYCWYQYHQ